MQPYWMLLLVALAKANPISESSQIKKEVKYFHVQTFIKATFFQATMYCSKMGMELVSFDNQKEFDDVRDSIIKNVNVNELIQFWTAGAIMEPKKFGWMNTGLPINLPTLWGPGEPNDIGKEECLELNIKGDDLKLYMNDASCSNPNYVICQSYKV